jgi:hypothetical protein
MSLENTFLHESFETKKGGTQLPIPSVLFQKLAIKISQAKSSSMSYIFTDIDHGLGIDHELTIADRVIDLLPAFMRDSIRGFTKNEDNLNTHQNLKILLERIFSKDTVQILIKKRLLTPSSTKYLTRNQLQRIINQLHRMGMLVKDQEQPLSVSDE